jgi:hypothetical protein
VASAAVRLTFRYDASGIQFFERDTLTKNLPESNATDPAQNTGVFVELRNAADAPLYRRDLGVVMGALAEVRNEDGELTRVQVDTVLPGVFTVLVPDIPEAQDFVLIASADRMPADLAQRLGLTSGGPAQPVLRGRLREDGVGIV